MNERVNFEIASGAAGHSKLSLVESTEFVVFQLGGLEYGIDMGQVLRLRGYRSLFRIPNGSGFVERVAISDGVLMPIVDLRLQVNITMPTFNHFTVVIILNILGRTVGLVVDSVSDVISLTASEVKPGSNFGLGLPLGAEHLTGVATYEGRSLNLIDINKLLSSTDSDLAEPCLSCSLPKWLSVLSGEIGCPVHVVETTAWHEATS